MTSGLLMQELPAEAPWLYASLREVLAAETLRVRGQERLKDDVHRLRVDVDGDERALVLKWSDPVVAHRNRVVGHRWLPAAGLEDVGPPLLAVAAEPAGRGAWHVYDDLPGWPLSTEHPVVREVEAAVEAIARVHTAFAEHALLPECRLWGGDRGIHFYSTNVRDAIVGLRALDVDRHGGDTVATRAALIARMDDLLKQEPERAQVLAAAGSPDTLLHGDLWPTNTIVVPHGDRIQVRLIDWDEAAVGPAAFDLSTFLLRFDPSDRAWVVDSYRRAVEGLAGWQLPGERELNSIFETAAYARLASLLVWSLAADAGEPDALLERMTDMCEWLDAVPPVHDT